ncbi:MAG: hypothetical protein FJX42_00260 [Alphaproteobacteria bacterium]|nr:hypothetical protein [Alphaproteobacteria bacterium]
MPFLNRPSFIALLQRLDGADDASVLAAAREISRRMKDGSVDWDDVLVRAGAGGGDGDAAADESGESDESGAASLSDADRAAARAEIAALMGKDGVGDQTKDDLKDLLGDLDRGDFGPSDLRYVRALAARVGAGPR